MYIILRACFKLGGKYGSSPIEERIDCCEGMTIKDVKKQIKSFTSLFINGQPVEHYKIDLKYKGEYMEDNLLVTDYYLSQGTKIYASLK